MKVRTALRQAGIEGYSLESKLITAKAAEKSVNELLRDLNLYTTEEVYNTAAELTRRRVEGEPVAYVTGTWEFYGMPMIVNSDVLIPRIDTEVLVDAVKEILFGHKMDARILDLCTGSGCIACAIAKELPATKLVAVDISGRALEVARQNIALNKLGSRVLTMQADATSSPPMSMGQFDMIVSNPPYIMSSDIMILDHSVRDFEPIWALDGGEDGLKFYKAIIKYWKGLLRKGGYLLFEVGENQAEDVQELLLAGGFSQVDTRKDTLDIERVVIAKY